MPWRTVLVLGWSIMGGTDFIWRSSRDAEEVMVIPRFEA